MSLSVIVRNVRAKMFSTGWGRTVPASIAAWASVRKLTFHATVFRDTPRGLVIKSAICLPRYIPGAGIPGR